MHGGQTDADICRRAEAEVCCSTLHSSQLGGETQARKMNVECSPERRGGKGTAFGHRAIPLEVSLGEVPRREQVTARVDDRDFVEHHRDLGQPWYHRTER
eukprot:200058-Rhodomonas_salina.1